MNRDAVNAVNDAIAEFRTLILFLNSEKLGDWDIKSDEEKRLRLLLVARGKVDKDYLLQLRADLRKTFLNLLKPHPNTADELECLWSRARNIQLQGGPLDAPRIYRHARVCRPNELEDWEIPSARIEIGGEPLAIVEYQYESSPEFSFYRIIEKALRSGVFSLLRSCPQCQRFFLREGRRSIYCSTDCERAFTYNKRIREGYYQEKMKESRERREQAKKQKARAQNDPQAYLKRLIAAVESDRTGRHLTVYKKLGGAQEGRKRILKLKNTPWEQIDPETRETISKLARTYPIP
jgi:hypothetical protein